MTIKESINVTRQGFEERFKEEKFYNRQTRDDNHLNLILNMIKLNKNRVLLDLGTGSGYLAFALAKENPNDEVIGIDIVKQTLKNNSKKAKMQGIRNLQFINYDGISFPFEDESIDVIYIRYALHHFPDIQSTFSEMKRVLKPQGKIVLSDPTPNENDKHRFVDMFMKKKVDGHVKLYTKRELEYLAERYGLRIISNVITKISFPRKGADEYKDLLRKYNKKVVNGYKIKVKGDEIFIVEKVINMVMEKKLCC